MIREIPEGSIEIQTGLWLYEYQKTIGGTLYTFRQLFSSENYCFYDVETVYYDNEGNEIAPENILPSQRLYYQWISLSILQSAWTYEQLNEKYISVPVQEGFDIANIPNTEVTM